MFSIFSRNPSASEPGENTPLPSSKPKKQTVDPSMPNPEEVKKKSENPKAGTSLNVIGAPNTSSVQSHTKSKGWFKRMVGSFGSASSARAGEEPPATLPPSRRMPTQQDTPQTNTDTHPQIDSDNSNRASKTDSSSEEKIEEQRPELPTNSEVSKLQKSVLNFLDNPPDGGVELIDSKMCEQLFAGMTTPEKLRFLEECNTFVQNKIKRDHDTYPEGFAGTNALDSVELLVRHATDSVGYRGRAAFLAECEKKGLPRLKNDIPINTHIKLTPAQQKDFIQYVKSLSKYGRPALYEEAYGLLKASTRFSSTEAFVKVQGQSHWVDYILNDPELANEFCKQIFENDEHHLQMGHDPFAIAKRLDGLVGLSENANKKIEAYMLSKYSKEELQDIKACMILCGAPRTFFNIARSNSASISTSEAIELAGNEDKQILKNFVDKVLSWDLPEDKEKAKNHVRSFCDNGSNLRKILNCYDTVDEKLNCLSQMDKKMGGKVKETLGRRLIGGGDPARIQNIILAAYKLLENDNASLSTINAKLEECFGCIPPRPDDNYGSSFVWVTPHAPVEVPDFDTTIFGNKQEAVDLILPYIKEGKTLLSRGDLYKLAETLTPGAHSLKFLTNFYHPDKYSAVFNSIQDPKMRKEAEEFIKNAFNLVNSSREATV